MLVGTLDEVDLLKFPTPQWHPLDGGFASRQPIEGVFVKPPPFVN